MKEKKSRTLATSGEATNRNWKPPHRPVAPKSQQPVTVASIAYGQSIPQARLRRLARNIHRLGERPLYELSRELSTEADLRERLERYAELDPGLVANLGGHDLPPPLRLIEQRRR